MERSLFHLENLIRKEKSPTPFVHKKNWHYTNSFSHYLIICVTKPFGNLLPISIIIGLISVNLSSVIRMLGPDILTAAVIFFRLSKIGAAIQVIPCSFSSISLPIPSFLIFPNSLKRILYR